MKRIRIFAALLLIVAMFAFTGCSKDDTPENNVGTGNTTGSGMVDDAENMLDQAAEDMAGGVDSMGGNNNGTDNTTGAAVNNN